MASATTMNMVTTPQDDASATTELVILADEYDMVLRCSDDEFVSYDLGVSLEKMSRTSSLFELMQSEMSADSIRDDDGRYVLDLPGDDPRMLRLLCEIIHGLVNMCRLVKNLEVEGAWLLLGLSEKYECQNVLDDLWPAYLASQLARGSRCMNIHRQLQLASIACHARDEHLSGYADFLVTTLDLKRTFASLMDRKPYGHLLSEELCELLEHHRAGHMRSLMGDLLSIAKRLASVDPKVWKLTRQQGMRQDWKIRDPSLYGALLEVKNHGDSIRSLKAHLLEDATAAVEAAKGKNRAGPLELYFALRQCCEVYRPWDVTLDEFDEFVKARKR